MTKKMFVEYYLPVKKSPTMIRYYKSYVYRTFHGGNINYKLVINDL